MKQYRWLVLISSLSLSACALSLDPDLQRIYGRSASTSYPDRNPIIAEHFFGWRRLGDVTAGIIRDQVPLQPPRRE